MNHSEPEVFNPDVGHKEIQARILQYIRTNRLPHAFLFYGNEGVGKEAFAIELAKLLNCEKGPFMVCGTCSQCVKIGKLQHPDVQFIFPIPASSNVKPETIAGVLKDKAENPYLRTRFPGKNTFISIDTIRELKREARFKLYEGKKKVFIISEADQMRPEAANALLKLLEEPPENLMLILITSHLHRILPTIRSRCQLIYFPPLPGDVQLSIIRRYLPEPPENLALITRLSMGNLKLAFDFLRNDVVEKREKAVEFLRKTVRIERSQELMKLVEELTSGKDREAMHLHLFFLLVWFRDAVHLKNSPERTEQIINSDMRSNLEGFVRGYPGTNFPACVEAVETAIEELKDPRNLNPALILTNLAIKLNRLIRK